MNELETAAGMAAAVASGEVSPVELVQRSLSRVQLWQDPTNAFTQLLFGAGLEEARRIEARSPPASRSGRWPACRSR